VTAPNRIMQLATTNNLDDDGTVGDRLIAFYEERAKGGVGLIVTEGLAAHESTRGSHATSQGRGRVGAFDPASLQGLRRLAQRIHEYDIPIFGQVFHGGRQHHADTIPMLWGPSAIPCPHSGGVPHAMTAEEIESTVSGFARAAVVLQEAGFDGVEVHGAQGHLIQEFLSAFSNQREDEYGGSFDNRMRFLREILDAVRAAVGPDFVVGFRTAGEEASPEGIDLQQACDIAAALEADGRIDYLSVSMGNFNSIEIHTPDRHFPVLPFIDHARQIRGAVKDLPIVACGRILHPDRAEEVLAGDAADIIGLCRPLLADADWAVKARDGRSAQIRGCISCNQCWGAIIEEREVLCVHNPVTGHELEYGKGTLTPVDRPRRVVVVGGGPAGMEAARVAAERGHQVTLFEARSHLGGSVSIAAAIPGHEEIGAVVHYLEGAIRRAGVDVRLDAPVAAADVLAERPDAVVVAAGSQPCATDLGAPTAFPVLTAWDVVADEADTGRRAIIFDEDGYYQACEVAEMMGRNGTEVTMVTRFWEIGREIPATSRVTTVRALDELGVRFMPTAWFGRVQGRDVVIEHYYSGREWVVEDVDCLVHIGRNHVRDDVYQDLKDQVSDLYVVGDAYMPRRIANAVSEGHRVGRQL
jgi:2,4-dienoyl-CoA reductase-like NADH-dependent reductase (Old Yellow Enzyme family)